MQVLSAQPCQDRTNSQRRSSHRHNHPLRFGDQSAQRTFFRLEFFQRHRLPRLSRSRRKSRSVSSYPANIELYYAMRRHPPIRVEGEYYPRYCCMLAYCVLFRLRSCLDPKALLLCRMRSTLIVTQTSSTLCAQRGRPSNYKPDLISLSSLPPYHVIHNTVFTCIDASERRC